MQQENWWKQEQLNASYATNRGKDGWYHSATFNSHQGTGVRQQSNDMKNWKH